MTDEEKARGTQVLMEKSLRAAAHYLFDRLGELNEPLHEDLDHDRIKLALEAAQLVKILVELKSGITAVHMTDQAIERARKPRPKE